MIKKDLLSNIFSCIMYLLEHTVVYDKTISEIPGFELCPKNKELTSP